MALKNLHPEDIKAAIRKTGISVSAVGINAGLTGSATRKALSHLVPAANRAIANHLKTTVQELWPEWFDERGNRKKSASSNRKVTRSKTACHRQKGTSQ